MLNEEGEVVQRVKLGLEIITESGERFHSKNVALLTNSSGINGKLEWNVDLFVKNGVNVIKLFSPEHGIWGNVAEGKKVSNGTLQRYNLPIISLFGKKKKPEKEALRNVDVLVYDIQDVGLRFYTYIYTLAYAMKACAENRVRVVVLDRPNPLSGKVEGPVIDENFNSFVGGYGLVLRYGMTVGELARYFNEEWKIGCDLQVVKMKGWKREYYHDQTGLPWVTPSPNLPSFEHTLLYAGMCVFEGVNLSVGRGTVHPFKYLGAPWLDSYGLKSLLEEGTHPGVRIREVHFTPSRSKYAREVCRGLEFFVTDREKFKPLEFSLSLLSKIRKLNPQRFQWENRSGRYHFDLIMGSDRYRKAIEGGKDVKKVVEDWKKESIDFKKRIAKYLFYD